MRNKASIKFIAKMCCLSLLIIMLAIASSQQIIFADNVDDVFEALQITKYAERQEASDFTLPAFDGEEKSLTDYKGSVILLNFWTTW